VLRRASSLALVGLLEFLAADIYSVVTIDLANGHGETGALVLVNYGNLVFTAICSVLPLAIVTSAFPVLSATDGDAFDQTSAGSNRAVVLMALLSTAIMIAVALPAAHVLTQKPDQVAPLAQSFLLFAPGVAGFAVVTNLSRVLFALGKLKVAGVGLVAQQLLPAALSFPLVLLAPPHLAVGALALASSVGQIAVAVPMVIATRRLRGSASVAGLGHATFAGIAAAAAAAAAGLAAALVMPTGGAVLETGVGAVSTLLAIVVFGVVAYALDKRDVRSAVGRLQRFARNRT
jgi:putative peptidoglycan lipid II flippase